MTKNQLTDRVLDGHLVLVGEYRNGRFVFRETVDRVSGEKIQSGQYVYAVECRGAFGTVMIYRPQSVPGPDLTVTRPGLEKGQRYAFDLDRLVRKGGFVTAHLSHREPELVE